MKNTSLRKISEYLSDLMLLILGFNVTAGLFVNKPSFYLSLLIIPFVLLFQYELKKIRERYSFKISLLMEIISDVLLTLILFGSFLIPYFRNAFTPEGNVIFINDFKYENLSVNAVLMLEYILVTVFVKCLRSHKKELIISLLSLVIFVVGDIYNSGDVRVRIFLFLVTVFKLLVYSSHERRNMNVIYVSGILGICVLGGFMLQPYIARIEKPVIESDSQRDDFISIFERNSHETVGNEENSKLEELLANFTEGNTIDNEAFFASDENAVFKIISNYPLDKVRLLTCGDYDPESDSFLLVSLDDEITEAEAAAAAKYLTKNVYRLDENKTPLKYRYELEPIKEQVILYVPYCDFIIMDDFVSTYKDRILYYMASMDRSYSVSFDPDVLYYYDSPSYRSYVYDTYLTIPEGFGDYLKEFYDTHGIFSLTGNREELIYKTREVLRNYYAYDNSPEDLPEGKDPILYFLSESKTGYFKHFAAAETLLYRYLGIPARYTFGYNITHYRGNTSLVPEGNAYAYCEVFIDGVWKLSKDVYVSSLNPEIEIGPHIETTVEEIDNKGEDAVPGKDDEPLYGPFAESGDETISRTSLELEDRTVMRIIPDEDFDYLFSHATGDYDPLTSSFLMNEDISEYESLSKIEDKDEYFKDLFTSSESKHVITVNNLSSGMWVYLPYGKPVNGEVLTHEDKAFLFDKTGNYSYYELEYDSDTSVNDERYTGYVYEKYLKVPEEMKEELNEFLLSKDINPSERDKKALLEKIVTLFKEEYTYTTEISQIPYMKDPLLYFLTESKEGYCEHYAGAGTLLLRMCGIPARYVTGYIGPFYGNVSNDVNLKDRHSYIQIYTSEGWKDLDLSISTSGSSFKVSEGNKLEGITLIERREPFDFMKLLKVLGCILIMGIVYLFIRLIKKMASRKPGLLSRINHVYLQLERNYFVSEKIRKVMLKIRYSEEHESAEDLEILNARKKDLLKMFRYSRQYLKIILLKLGDLFFELKCRLIKQ